MRFSKRKSKQSKRLRNHSRTKKKRMTRMNNQRRQKNQMIKNKKKLSRRNLRKMMNIIPKKIMKQFKFSKMINKLSLNLIKKKIKLMKKLKKRRKNKLQKSYMNLRVHLVWLLKNKLLNLLILSNLKKPPIKMTLSNQKAVDL